MGEVDVEQRKARLDLVVAILSAAFPEATVQTQPGWNAEIHIADPWSAEIQVIAVAREVLTSEDLTLRTIHQRTREAVEALRRNPGRRVSIRGARVEA
jgi:hypothetical protein